jgi:hypothetical protein
MASSVVLGLPKQLRSQPEAALSPECFSQMTRVFPNNVPSVSATSTMSIAVGIYSDLAFTAQEVRFSIPAGMGKNVFIDSSKTRLNYRLKVVNTAGTMTAAKLSAYLQSSAYSWWDRIQTFNANGVAVDDVVGLAQIMCHKNNFEFDSSERDSMWQYGFLCEEPGTSSQNNLQGHPITQFTKAAAVALPVATNYYDYSVPLPSSLIGPMARNFCPIGALQALNISLWTNSLMPIVYQIETAAATAGSAVTVTLDNISIDLHYIYLDQTSSSLLNLGKEYYIHSITNRLSTGTINAGTQGQVSTLIGLRGRSVRALATRFSQNTRGSTGSANGVYDSQIIPCNQMNYFINGKDRVPSAPHNSLSAPSTVFEHALQSVEAFTAKDTKYGGTVDTFCNYVVTTAALSDNASNWYGFSGNSTVANSLAGFAFAESMQVASSSQILDGRDFSTSSSHFLELNISQIVTAAVNVSFISSQDIIYVIDLQTGNVESRL